VGKKLADQLGCQIVAARVNIGSKESDPIYREYLFVGRRTGCRFDVGKGDFYEKFSPDRRLAVIDPDTVLDPSDFAGFATLGADGKLTVSPKTLADEYTFQMPGSFDGACKSGREVKGGLIPLDEVKCGDVPAPKHDTTPDDTSLEACQEQGKTDLQTILQKSIFQGGSYDYIVKHVEGLGAIPLLEYAEELQTLEAGQVLRPAVFVGKNFENRAVVTVVDMEVVRVAKDSSGNTWVSVRFLSDACSYDKHGNAVFVFPKNCKELLPYKGLFTQLTTVNAPHRPSPPPPPDDENKPPEPGSGSKSALLKTPLGTTVVG
jgi:hypothetical protein